MLQPRIRLGRGCFVFCQSPDARMFESNFVKRTVTGLSKQPIVKARKPDAQTIQLQLDVRSTAIGMRKQRK